MKRWLAAALVAGCHSNPPPKAAGDPPCLKVAHHMLDLMTKDAPPDAAKTIVDMIVERCDRDAWSPDAQQCLLAMQSLEDNTKCEELLTVPQRDALAKEIDEKLPRAPQPPPDAAQE